MKKSIIINQRAHKELKKLSVEFNRPIGRFTEDMISFFRRTGQDPSLNKEKTPSQMIRIVDKRIVSFFKTQESEILYPLRISLKNSIDENKDFFAQLLENLNSIFGKVRANHDELTKEMENIKREVEHIKSKIQ